MNIKPTASLTLLCLFFVTFTFSQPSEQDIKNALASSIGIANSQIAKNGAFITPGEYVVVDGKVVGQHYTTTTFYTSHKGGNVGFAYPDIMLGKINNIILENPDCTREFISIANGDVVELDVQGRPVKVEDRSYAVISKGFMKEKYLLEYLDGKLSKVTGYEIIAEGKSISSAKVKEEKLKFTTLYNWSADNKLQVTIDLIMGVNKKGKLLTQKTNTHYTIGENSLIIENFQNGSISYRAEYVKAGNELRKNINTSVTEIATLQDGKVVKNEYWEYGANKTFKSHTLSVHHYELKSPDHPKDQVCSYNVTTETSIYNEAGTVVEERKGSQGRIRNADGTWGPWFTYRM